MLSDFDMRVNSPILSERISGELLYSQTRMRPLTSFSIPDSAFNEENTAENTKPAWTAPLTEAEASAVAGYTSRRARWLDVLCINPSVAASSMGMSQFHRLGNLERELRSAVGKSMTYSMVLRHYVRDIPSPQPGEPPMRGRVYVLKSYTSCSLVPRDVAGYGSHEVRIVSTPGVGRGVFVSEPGACLSDAEFVLLPGTTIRVTGCGGGLLTAEQVRPLSTSWKDRCPVPFSSSLTKEDSYSTERNRNLISVFRHRCVSNLFPDIAPAPTLGW